MQSLTICRQVANEHNNASFLCEPYILLTIDLAG